LRVNADATANVGARRWWLWLALSIAIVIADQMTKSVVLATLRPAEERVVTSFFSVILAFNAGAAFSFLGRRLGLAALPVQCSPSRHRAHRYLLLRRVAALSCARALSLILGGALGNLWDRASLGRVVDFMLFHDFLPQGLPGAAWIDPFPAFNVADSAITIGAALLILDSFRHRPPRVPASK
jgi:signal peptidase II